jgi:hypothetical protein
MLALRMRAKSTIKPWQIHVITSLRVFPSGKIPAIRDTDPEGVRIYQPVKKPKGKELTKEQKSFNRDISLYFWLYSLTELS